MGYFSGKHHTKETKNKISQSKKLQYLDKSKHPKNYEKRRYAIFKKYGFKNLFLNEDDLCCDNWKEVCLNKIQVFLDGS